MWPGGSDLGSIWFTYTPAASGPVILMVDASNATVHELHVLSLAGSELGCSVAENVWPGGTIDLDVTAGETYLLGVVGPTVDSETVGDIVIEGVATISLEPPTTGQINAAGDVEATFVFTCSRPMSMEVGMDLTQGAGSSLVRGGELITVNCDAPSTAVTLTANGTRNDGITSADFRNGLADWRYDWNAITRVQLFPDADRPWNAPAQRRGRFSRGTDDHRAADRLGADPIGWRRRRRCVRRRAGPGLDRAAVGRGLAAPQAAQVPSRMTRGTRSESSSSTRSAR